MPPTATQRIQIVMPKFRLSYQHLTTPRKKDPNGRVLEEKDWSWEVLGIFDPVTEMAEADQKRWRDAMAAAKIVKDNFFTNGVPANYRSPLRDGTQYNQEHGNKNPEFIGKVLINMKSKGIKPGVVNAQLQPIVDPSQVYSGCYGLADGSWFAYNKLGNVGISFGLNNFMKLADGEPLANMNNPESAFREINVARDYGTDNAAMFAGNTADDLGI